MSLDHGFPYLRTEGFDLPALLPDFDYDPTAHRFTIPVILPPDNETKLTLHGFYSADGVAADPVIIRCEIGTNNYSDEQLRHFSKAAQDPRLKQLLTSMKTARAQYTSGIETVQTVSLNTEGPVYSMLSASQALFKWEGTNRFYEDISDIMNIKAFILGTDGNACWMYGNQEKEGHRLDTCPAASVDIHMSVADPFNLTRRSVESAIAKGKLVYEGQSQLGGRLCYRVGTWYARQTGHDVFSVQAGKFEWWIDAKTFLLLRLVQHRSGGEDTLTFDYQELNQPLPDSAFQPPIASGPGVVSDDWFNKKLGPGEIRFLTIKDGSSGTMSGRIGRQGPNGSTDAGLN